MKNQNASLLKLSGPGIGFNFCNGSIGAWSHKIICMDETGRFWIYIRNTLDYLLFVIYVIYNLLRVILMLFNNSFEILG